MEWSVAGRLHRIDGMYAATASDGREEASGLPLSLLLVEDNPAHATLVLRSFESSGAIEHITHLSDGETALDYLFRRGAFSDPETSPRPQAVLLDLRLPKIDGLSVLEEIRSSAELETLPIVILTTSKAESDVLRAYRFGVNSYIVKPFDFKVFARLMRDLSTYWLCWNHYPRWA